jgi:adenylosuccinate lyase
MSSLLNVSSIDGRYAKDLAPVSHFFGEGSLYVNRIKVSLRYVAAIAAMLDYITEEEMNEISAFPVTLEHAEIATKIDHDGYYDPQTNKTYGPLEHDLKSATIVAEIILHNINGKNYSNLVPLVHIALTSEDINNIAYALSIKGFLGEYTKKAKQVCEGLSVLISKNSSSPLLSRTHGQPASPTTFGKEIALFLNKLYKRIDKIINKNISVKLNGAVGNFNAHKVISHLLADDIKISMDDWFKFSESFCAKEWGLVADLYTAQRGPKDSIIDIMHEVSCINSIVRDFCVDMWLYCSRYLVLQIPVATHAGSSAMPHKINPWMVECAESNAKISTELLQLFIRDIDVSRLQRDLSDHDFERNYGTAFCHSYIALNYMSNFIQIIHFSQENADKELDENQQVLSEAFQVAERISGDADGYTKIKNLFRKNKPLSLEEVEAAYPAIDSLGVKTAREYCGYAKEIAEKINSEYVAWKTASQNL